MKRIWKRSLATFLALVLTVGMLPMQVLALEEGESFDVSEADAAVTAVQAMIDALDSEVASEEEAAALQAALSEVDDAIDALSQAQYEQLDPANYLAAQEALKAYGLNADEPMELDTTITPVDLAVKDGTIKESEFAAQSGDKFDTSGKYYWGFNATSDSNKDWNEIKISEGIAGIGADPDDDLTFTDGKTVYVAEKKWYQTGKYYWVGAYRYDLVAAYTIKVYHEITATLDGTTPEGASVSVTAADTDKVSGIDNGYYTRKQVTITASPVEGYEAKIYNGDTVVQTLNSSNNWKYEYTATASVDYTVKYSRSGEKYDVTVNVENGDYGSASLVGTETSFAWEDAVKLNITPNSDTNSTHYSYTVSIEDTNKDAQRKSSYDADTRTITMGTSPVTVTVTFTKYELTANESGSVNFDFTKTVADQLDTLKAEILDKLGVQCNGQDVTGVTIEYFPYYSTKILGKDFCDEDKLRELTATAPDDIAVDVPFVGRVGYTYYNFGERALNGEENTVEKVRISYTVDGVTLFVDALITLADNRAETQIVATNENVELTYKDFKNADLIEALGLRVQYQLPTEVGGNDDAVAAADVTADNWSDLADAAITVTEGCENSSVGKATVTFSYAGNSEYKPSTASFDVTITQASASIDVPSVSKKYDGTAADPTITATRGNRHGEDSEITDSLIKFVVGLNTTDEDGKLVGSTVQVILPDSLNKWLGETGTTVSLDGLMELLKKIPNIGDLIGDESLSALFELLKSLSDSLGGLDVTLGGTLPSSAGVYLYGAVSTNPNYTTAFDVSYIIITPDAMQVYLGFDHAGTVFTPSMFEGGMTLNAGAYSDSNRLEKDNDASEKVQNLFFGINDDGKLVLKRCGANTEETRGQLGQNGAFTQLAYIAEVANEMDYAVPIARAFVLIPDTVTVTITDGEGTGFIRTYDGDAQSVNVTVTTRDGSSYSVKDGCLTVTYTGLTTAGETYNSSVAPTNAGAYLVTARYVEKSADGKYLAVGGAVQTLLVKPAQGTIEVNGEGYVPYDGNKHGATVDSNGAYTLISGTASVGGNVTEVGLDAISANLNIDFPANIDKLLPASIRDGISAQTLNAALKTIDSEANWVKALVSALEKVPEGMTVTFNDDVKFTDPGVYVFYGIVTDSNYIPAGDTGLLVIEKQPSGLVFKDTTVTYDGDGHEITVENPNNTDYVTIIIDRGNNIGNIIFEDDLKAIKNWLEEKLGREISGTYDVKTVIEAINNALDAIESALPEGVTSETLTKLRAALAQLPQSGTVYLDDVWRPTDAGEYEFYGLAVSPVYETTLMSAKLTIEKKDASVTVGDLTIRRGAKVDLSKVEVTTEGFLEKDNIEWTLSLDGRTIKATLSGEKLKNYDVTITNGTLNVKGGSRPTGSSTATTLYDIDVEQSRNGDVLASRSEASSGTTIYLISIPQKGYTLKSLTVVNDRTGKEVTLASGVGVYSFDMPASDVTVIPNYVAGGAAFDDVSNDYYYDPVYWAADCGITDGMDATHFAPLASCTRAHIVTFLWRAAGSPSVKDVKNPFVDVTEKDYFYDAVLWAVEKGITDGMDATHFAPNATCTRAHAVTFIYRNEKANGGGFTGAWMFKVPFTDVPEWCFEAVAWCYMNSITDGFSETVFAPDSDCTRGQIVTFLYRYYECIYLAE